MLMCVFNNSTSPNSHNLSFLSRDPECTAAPPGGRYWKFASNTPYNFFFNSLSPPFFPSFPPLLTDFLGALIYGMP